MRLNHLILARSNNIDYYISKEYFMSALKKVLTLQLNDYHSSDPKVKAKFIDDLKRSLEEFGFVVISGHTIPHELIKKLYAVQKKYFELPVEEKMKNFVNNGGQRGYTKFGTEHAKGFKVSDLKEFYHVGREQFLPNTWPESIPEFKPTVEALIGEMDKVGDTLLSAIGEIVGCGPDYLPSIVKDGASVLRMLHYPPIPSHLEQGQIRANAHTDIDLITGLLAANGAGLELQTKDGEWIAVESDPNSIVFNIGDMLSRMCNFKIPSTIHRVTNPTDGKNESRFSCPYFVHPRGDVRLELLPKYAHETPVRPIATADEYLEERLKEIGLKK
jgi:isopenicillin N synthase-like dioxygenase